jgi:hypothetical protein
VCGGLLLLLLAVVAGLALVPGISRAVISAPALVRVGEALAPPPGSVLLGPVAQATAIGVDVVLAPRDPGQLAQLAAAVSSPSSADYRDYVPPAVVAKRFAPGASVIATVRAALSSRGLSNGRLIDGGLVLSFATTAGQVESTFSLSLSRYRVPGRPSVTYGASAAPLVPSAGSPASTSRSPKARQGRRPVSPEHRSPRRARPRFAPTVPSPAPRRSRRAG